MICLSEKQTGNPCYVDYPRPFAADELRSFVDSNCGDGTLYATPSEFVRDMLRQRKLQQEAQAVREGILAGNQDAVAGRLVEFKGDLQAC